MRKQLHPGTKWSLRIQGLFTGIFLAFILSWFFGFIFAFMFVAIANNPAAIVGALFSYVIIYIVVILVFAEIYARMAYNRWFYEFTGEQLRIEKGIIWKKYSNIPYERVQNVDITRGIIARLCGFSTVNIQTAGFSYAAGKGMPQSEGYIPGVSFQEAEQIREFLMKKISKKGRSQGL